MWQTFKNVTYYETLHAREILEVRNVSLELTLSNCTRLSLVDSGFNSQATSFFGAKQNQVFLVVATRIITTTKEEGRP